MSDNIPEAPTGVSARRRLLRGAFVAPAALTLCSGSAFAATSISACVSNQNKVGSIVTKGIGVDSTGWVRVQIYQTSLTGKDSSLWVKGGDLVVLATAPAGKPALPTPYLTATQFECVGAGDSTGNTSGYVVGNVYSSSTPPVAPSPLIAVNATYATVRVDSTGKIVQVADFGSGGSAIGTTCWTSFAGVKSI